MGAKKERRDLSVTFFFGGGKGGWLHLPEACDGKPQEKRHHCHTAVHQLTIYMVTYPAP